MSDNVLWSLQCVPGGSRFHQARWFHYQLLANKEKSHESGPVYPVVHVVLPTVTCALSPSFILGHLCFRLLLVSAPLDVHCASIVATFSDCRHNGNWHTVYGVECFGDHLFLLHLNKSPSFIRVPRGLRQRFRELIQKNCLVRRQLVHTRARMASNHDKNHDERASQNWYPVTCRRPTGCSFIL